MNSKERELRRSIGRKIKLARSKAEYTQEELAEKIDINPAFFTFFL